MNDSTLDLNGVWELYGTDDFPTFLVAQSLPGRHAWQAKVPASIQQVLQNAGVLDDPRVGLNSLRARWVEEQYWGYRRVFATPQDCQTDTPAWLVFERLELNAVVYLNREEVGRHANAHRPARFDVTGKLRGGTDGAENVLVVLIESGLFANADRPGEEYRASPQAKLTKIHWQRRGQWQRGWDWQQRLLTVGITGDVRLEWSNAPVLSGWTVYGLPSDDLSRATFHAHAEIIHGGAEPVSTTLHLSTGATEGGNKSISVTIEPGLSRHSITVEVENPLLWWPLGHGAQNLYQVSLSLQSPSPHGLTPVSGKKVGVRKVEMDQSPHPTEGRYFTLKINDRPLFCKGGNWVPPDMDPSTVTPERLRELVDLALAANFNLLRIWGGGVFADPALLDYCDEKGVLVWHDLLFACSKYPGDYPDFADEVRREVTHAVRKMAHHASLVVWCGNNEIEEGDWHWGYDGAYRTHPHYALFHHDLPQIVTRESPGTFYWISSPYSPDYKSPRDPTVGDQHPWKVSLQMPGGADWWEYRQMVDRFPNEGGVLGCSSPATLRQFLPPGEQHLLSASWEHHDNPFAMNDTQPGQLGHAYQTVRLWTGLDPLTLDMERYAFVSGLLQAEGLTEYITNFRRRMFSSSAAIFWMYNDSWPATHGWTIVDYYRRKKLAYHPVRRAFAPVAIFLAEENGSVCAYGVNETAEPVSGQLWMGAFTSESKETDGFWDDVTLPPNSSTKFAGIKMTEQFDRKQWGICAALIVDEAAEDSCSVQARLLMCRFHEFNLVPNPKIDLSLENGMLTLKSEVFVWGVCLDTNGESPVADNCFDLLPDIPYSLPWDKAILGEPRVLRTGNTDARL